MFLQPRMNPPYISCSIKVSLYTISPQHILNFTYGPIRDSHSVNFTSSVIQLFCLWVSKYNQITLSARSCKTLCNSLWKKKGRNVILYVYPQWLKAIVEDTQNIAHIHCNHFSLHSTVTVLVSQAVALLGMMNWTPGLLATYWDIHIQIILTINLSEYVLNKPNKPTHKHM